MGSPNGGVNSSPMNRPYRCKLCGKTYAMDWAFDNHKNRHKNEGEVYPVENDTFGGNR